MRQTAFQLHTVSASIWLAGGSISDPATQGHEARDFAGSERIRPIVLVVDDEKLIVDTMVEILEGAGFDVIGAYDGWTALEQIARRRPDYVLSDVLMPQMNGVELAIAIQKMHPTTRIILFSGQAGISEILLEGQRQGFEFELIAKPIHPLRLIEHLRAQ
jgi:DNA-binding NtrC family response regulator